MSNSETLEKNNQTAKDLLSFVAKGVYHTKIIFVGAYFVDTPENGDGSWVLVDTGLPMSDGRIRRAAKSKYGDKKPSAIILTHGHFDHAGAALALAEQWNVPIYVHRLEMPYLTGEVLPFLYRVNSRKTEANRFREKFARNCLCAQVEPVSIVSVRPNCSPPLPFLCES